MESWNKKRTLNKNKGNLNKAWNIVNNNASIFVH